MGSEGGGQEQSLGAEGLGGGGGREKKEGGEGRI